MPRSTHIPNPVNADVVASVLPTGAATETTLASIDAKLPAGGLATAAKQDTGNVSLASIDAKLPAGGLATEAKQDVGNTYLQTISTTGATSAKQDTGNASLSSIDGKLPAAAAAADGESNATTMTELRARELVYNGTTWDMLRGSLAGIVAGVIATWTGMLQVLGLGRYLAARPTLADGQGTHLQLNARGDLAVQEQYIPSYEDNANSDGQVTTSRRGCSSHPPANRGTLRYFHA